MWHKNTKEQMLKMGLIDFSRSTVAINLQFVNKSKAVTWGMCNNRWQKYLIIMVSQLNHNYKKQVQNQSKVSRAGVEADRGWELHGFPRKSHVSLVVQMVKNQPANAGDLGPIPGLGRRAWQPTPVFLPGESPWTEELGGLQSMGSQRGGHDWATNHSKEIPCSLTWYSGGTSLTSGPHQLQNGPHRGHVPGRAAGLRGPLKKQRCAHWFTRQHQKN